MRVPGNKQLGRLGLHNAADDRLIALRIAADMNHEHIDPLTLKTVLLRKARSYFFTVNVAKYTAQGFEGSKPVDDLYASEIASVPDFIAMLEMAKYRLVQIAVRIRNKTYFLHSSKLELNKERL